MKNYTIQRGNKFSPEQRQKLVDYLNELADEINKLDK